LEENANLWTASGGRAPSECNVASRRRKESSDESQQRRLPGAVWAKECDRLARANLQRNAAQHLTLAIRVGEPVNEKYRHQCIIARRARAHQSGCSGGAVCGGAPHGSNVEEEAK